MDIESGLAADELPDARGPGWLLKQGCERFVEAAARAALADSSRTYKNVCCAAVLVFVAAAVLCIGAGPVIQNKFGHDTPLLLDGAWKIFWGYRPHVDYYSPFADLECLLIAAGMKLIGPTVLALPLANTLFALAVATTAWIVGRRRFSPLLLLIFVLLAGFVALSAHQLRFPFWETTYTTLYNRHGYALVLTLAVVLFLPARDGASRGDLRDGILAGVLWALLPFIKITFFLVAGAFFICRLAVARPTRRWMSGLLAGGLVTGLPFLIYLGFDLPAYMHDLTAAAGARQGTLSLKQPFLYLWSVHESWELLTLMGMLVILSIRSPVGGRSAAGSGWSRVLAGLDGGILLPALCFVLCTTFIMSTNAPDGDLTEVPLLAVGAIILMEYSGRTLRGLPRQVARDGWSISVTWMHFAVCVLGLFITAEVLGRDAASVVYGTLTAIVDGASFGKSSRFQSSSMSDMVFVGFAGERHMLRLAGERYVPSTYADKINDGLRLLDRNVPRTSHVEDLDFTNPFPFAALRPPTRGGPLAWQLGFTFNRTNYPAAAKVFAEVDHVMIPQFPGDPETGRALREVYRDYLLAHFELQAISSNWILLRRKPGDVP